MNMEIHEEVFTLEKSSREKLQAIGFSEIVLFLMTDEECDNLIQRLICL